MEKPFIKQLFDSNFESFITRKVSQVFYTIWMIIVAAFTLFGIFAAISLMVNPYGDFAIGLLMLMGVPVASFVALILVRLLFETSIALVLIAENTSPKKPDSEN